MVLLGYAAGVLSVVMTHLNQPKRNATGTAAAAEATLSEKKARRRGRRCSSTSNGGAADDLIVKYINQDIEAFHLARNCQVLSGADREGKQKRKRERERNGTQLTAVQVFSKVDNVTVGTEKQAAYWRC